MKRNVTVMLLSVAFVAASCTQSTDPPSQTAAKESVPKIEKEAKAAIAAENLEKVEYSIKGMTCAYGCAKMIEKKLAGADGVQSAQVDFESGAATVSFDRTRQSTATLKKTIEDLAGGATYKATEGDSAKG